MGRALVGAGPLRPGHPVLAGAIGPLEKANEWLDWAPSIAYHGVAVTATGLPKEGMAETQQAVTRARETKSPTILAGCLIVLGFQSFLTRTWRRSAPRRNPPARPVGRRGLADDLRGLGFEARALGLLGGPTRPRSGRLRPQAEAGEDRGRLVAADWIAAGGAEIALNAGRLVRSSGRRPPSRRRAPSAAFSEEGMAQRTWGLALARLDPPQQTGRTSTWRPPWSCSKAADVLEVAHTNLAWGGVRLERGDSAGAANGWHWQPQASRPRD